MASSKKSSFLNYSLVVGSASVLVLLISLQSAHAFFIDLEALGFSNSKSDESSSSSGGNDAKLLIAAPSEQQLVEVDSKTDPNKSVKLTLGELKQLILGSVKDMTPNPPPINIKISGIKDSFAKLTSTTTTETPMKINKYKYKNSVVTVDPYEEPLPAQGGEFDEDSVSPYWNNYKRPTMSYEDAHLYSNEVNPSKLKSGEVEDENGWFTAAKSVFRRPNLNSLSRWRNGGEPQKKMKSKPPRRRPIADITYSRQESRRRRKRPGPGPRQRRPRPRNHSSRTRSRRPQSQRRRVQSHSHSQSQRYGPPAPSYSAYADDSEFYGEYDGGYQSQNQNYQSWDRVGSFDSTRPQDDTPFNMSPPMSPAMAPPQY